MASNRRSRARFIESLEDRRLLSGGTLDPSFGKTGIATVSQGSLKLSAISVASRSDGKVIVLGEDESMVSGVFFVPRVVLARLNTDGSLDKTFGSNGIALVSDLPNFSNAYALAIQSDNRIVVASDHTVGSVFSGKTDAQVIRFTANGQIDTSFGINTLHTSTFNFGDNDDSDARAIAIQRDGKIVIAGRAHTEGFFSGFSDNAYIARLNSNGTLDTSFADHGINILDMNENDAGQSLAINYNGTSSNPTFGEIMMTGSTGTFDNPASKLFVVRFLKNGKVDGSFGHGIVTARISSMKYNDARALVIQSDSKTVVAAAVAGQPNFNKNFGILRFNNDGTLDKSFGASSSGAIQVDFGGDDQADSIVVNDTGELLVGGTSESQTAVTLLSKVGKPDPAFGPNGNGKVIVGVKNTTIGANGIALSRGGTFVVAGGDKLTTERFYDRSPATVSIKVLDASASETNKDPGSFLISRAEKLNTTTRVYFSLGGSATSPFSLLRTQIDYTGPVPAPPPIIGTGGSSGISHLGQAYVDIPPGQTQTSVTIVPNDDTRVESDEAVFASLVSDPGYDINPTFPSGVVAIHDNDGAPGTTLSDTADAYVRDGTNAGANFGTGTDIEVKKGGSGFNRVAYIKFDLSSVSAINSVKLNLFGKLSDTQDASLATSLFSVADTSWTETGINFNNAPLTSASALATATITGTTLQMVQFDVTTYVKAQFAAGHKVVSFALKNAASSNSFVQFNSREASSNKPALVIS